MPDDVTKKIIEKGQTEENGASEKGETPEKPSPPFIRDSSECPERDKHKLFLSGLTEQEGVL